MINAARLMVRDSKTYIPHSADLGGEFDGIDRAVDKHLRRLRQKLGGFPEKIATVWGVGYRSIG